MAAPAYRKAQSRHELRKHVPAVGTERQWLDPQDTIERQLAIEMWKQCARARGLPSERRTKTASVDRNQHQIGCPGKMLGCGLLDLACAGEMDIAVALVDAGAAELAGGLGVLPLRRIADLVDGVRHGPDLGLARGVPRPSRDALQRSTPPRRRASPARASIRGFVHSPDASLG